MDWGTKAKPFRFSDYRAALLSVRGNADQRAHYIVAIRRRTGWASRCIERGGHRQQKPITTPKFLFIPFAFKARCCHQLHTAPNRRLAVTNRFAGVSSRAPPNGLSRQQIDQTWTHVEHFQTGQFLSAVLFETFALADSGPTSDPMRLRWCPVE